MFNVNIEDHAAGRGVQFFPPTKDIHTVKA